MRAIDLSGLKALMKPRQDVLFAVVFGSAASGEIRPDSDVDVGVCFDRSPDTDALAEFMVSISDALGTDDIDLVDLSKADPILAFEALCGRVICRHDPAALAEFTSLVCREYEDIMARLNAVA